MKIMKTMKISLLLLSISVAWGQLPNPNGIVLGTLNPAPPTNISAAVIGTPGNTTYYYWPIANYPIGQAIVNTPLVVNNAPNTLSVSNYVQISASLPNASTTIDVVRTNIPQLSVTGTQSIAVATGTTGVANDQGSALTSYTFNNALPATAMIRLNNRDFSVPRLEFAIGINSVFGPLPVSAGGNGVITVPVGPSGGTVYSASQSVTLAQLNAGIILVPGINLESISIVNFFIVSRGGATAACTDVRFGDSNFANALVIDPIANLTQNAGNTSGTSTITQIGYGHTPFGLGLGIGLFKTGSACTTATSYDVIVHYTVSPVVN